MPVQSESQDYLSKVQGDLEASKRSHTPAASSIVSKNMESTIEPRKTLGGNRRASIINTNVPAEAGMEADAESMKGFQTVLEMICHASMDAVVIIDSTLYRTLIKNCFPLTLFVFLLKFCLMLHNC